MPILPKGVTQIVSAPVGGSPRGWSFISSGLTCWRQWAYRYLFGLYPQYVPPYFDLGSAYHAFQEGKTEAEVAKLYPAHVTEAKALYVRRQAGPPMPPATAIEETVVIFGGRMTSKPDRVEGTGVSTVVRDFKTAMTFSENDEAAWGTDGGILGEAVAAKTTKAIVDIVKKGEVRGQAVKLVNVTLTVGKFKALEMSVNDFWENVSTRVKVLAAYKTDDASTLVASFNKTFPANFKGCTGKYGKCAYYDKCWASPPASMLYRRVEPPTAWHDDLGGVERFAKGLTKQVLTARKLFKKVTL